MRLEDLPNISELEFLGKGCEGVCYDLGDGNKLKLYADVRELSEIEKFKYMLKHKNESFLFPFEFISDEEYLLGYISKKSLGQKLEKIFSSLNLEQLSSHSIKLEHNIRKLSQAKILLQDFHDGNIMYNKDKLEVIDPDFYRIDTQIPIKKIQKINLNSYKLTILEAIKTNIIYTKKASALLSRLEKYQDVDIDASDTIIKIKEDLEKYYKEKIDTIDDLNEILRR